MNIDSIIMANYILSKIECNEAIKLTEPNDIHFSNIAQEAIVTGATLPSGLKISNDGEWKIYGNFIIKNHQIDASSLGQSSNVSETNPMPSPG
jgi:hypothetical protein